MSLSTHSHSYWEEWENNKVYTKTRLKTCRANTKFLGSRVLGIFWTAADRAVLLFTSVVARTCDFSLGLALLGAYKCSRHTSHVLKFPIPWSLHYNLVSTFAASCMAFSVAQNGKQYPAAHLLASAAFGNVSASLKTPFLL